MPFKFEWLCELLEELYNKRHHRATTAARAQDPQLCIIKRWFDKYDRDIERTGPPAVAFLSSLFPERRADRVYCLQEKRISALFARSLGLGAGRTAQLNQWRERDGDDLATCVERVMAQCEFEIPESGRAVTLEELDAALQQIAANTSLSSPAVREIANTQTVDGIFTPIVRRLQSKHARWLVHMIMKSHGPVRIPERYTMLQFHFILPDLLIIQNSIEAAVQVMGKATICTLPPRPNKEYEAALRLLIAKEMMPELGIMIRRQPYHKARSIKHCCNLANERQMSVERKYDGEYCQIHIDRSKGQDCIQIFSKSGKDSTRDRARLHASVKKSLRLDSNNCRIRQRCIIEGELIVWSAIKKQFLPFHKIRKHVKHGGRYMGTARDSPIKADERLMIVYYDLLMLDHRLLLNEPLTLRRQHLKALVRNVEGCSIIAERSIIDFSSGRAPQRLRDIFASSISQRWEGLVLKACDEAFFSFKHQNHGIKLKKDYIRGLGDSADLCLIGGRRESRAVTELGIGPLRWTMFSIACILNKTDIQRFGAKPIFKLLDEIGHYNMPKSDILDLNRLGRLREMSFSLSSDEFDIESDETNTHRPTELFKVPFVVEIMGAGFDRLSNSSFYTLRFPRKIGHALKIHTDRTLAQTTSFNELQNMAKACFQVKEDLDSQEDVRWIERLLAADGKGRGTQETTQSISTACSLQSAPSLDLGIDPLTMQDCSLPFVREDTEDIVPNMHLDEAEDPDIEHPLQKFITDLEIPDTTTSISHSSNTQRQHCRTKKGQARISEGLHAPANTKRRRLQMTDRGLQSYDDQNDDIALSSLRVVNARNAEVADRRQRSTGPSEGQYPSPTTGHPSYPSTLPVRCSGHASTAIICSSTLMPNMQAIPKLAIRPSTSGAIPELSVRGRALEPTSENSHRRRSGRAKRVEELPFDSRKSQSQQVVGSPVKIISSPKKTLDVFRDAPCIANPINRQWTVFASSTEAALSASVGLALDQPFPPLRKMDLDQETCLSSPKIIQPILVASSASHRFRTHKATQSLLANSTSSFTYSLDLFLDEIDNATIPPTPTDPKARDQSLHVVLIDFLNLAASKMDLHDLFSHFTFRSHGRTLLSTHETMKQNRGSTTYHDRVLVYDFRILRRCTGQRIDEDFLRSLRDDRAGRCMFGGIIGLRSGEGDGLSYGPQIDVLGATAKYKLRTDWNWLES